MIRSFAILILLCATSAGFSYGQQGASLEVPVDADTAWWVGIVNHGHLMPLSAPYDVDLFGDTYGNQAQPLLLSDQGHVIWSPDPPRVVFDGDRLHVETDGADITYDRPGRTLREAYLAASEAHFPPSGEMPDRRLFTAPQYNTWIELMYDQNQEDILQYARDLIDQGYPPGVLMIDDNWQEDYGKWDFHPGRFDHPKAMVDSLHAMGFTVMLWLCPWVSPDSDVYRQLRDDGLLLKNDDGQPALVRWWNGASGLLDFTDPGAVAWFKRQLDHLTDTYGVDGFKLDGGDAEYYVDVVADRPVSPNAHSMLYGGIGLDYPLNEYRAMWKMGGEPLAERLRDKAHDWADLRKLIPHILLQGISGYAFSCPDMIGGGEYGSFLSAETLDQALVVRSAQASALMPMMQFSVAPWRILDDAHRAAVHRAVEIRQRYVDRIVALAEDAAQTGEPIVRSLEYVFPHRGYRDVQDQFMLGDCITVAPVLEAGATSRTLEVPPGQWQSFDGRLLEGPRQITVDVQLDTLPYLECHSD